MSASSPEPEPTLQELRAGRWGIHPAILAEAAPLPRRSDGSPYTQPNDRPEPTERA